MSDLSRIIIFGLVLAVTVGIIALAVRAVRWARNGSPAASFVGWALLLLGVGMNPRPPPQEQVEEVNRERRLKKQAESGDPPD